MKRPLRLSCFDQGRRLPIKRKRWVNLATVWLFCTTWVMAGSPSLPPLQTSADGLTGYLIAPKTGDYVLWTGGKEKTALSLSPGTDPASKVKVAWNDAPDSLDSATRLPLWLSNGSQTARSSANTFTFGGGRPGVIHLEAGRLYYLKVDSADPGTVALGWTKPGDPAGEKGPAERIPARFLSPNLVAVPNIQLNNDQLAARFLNQATMGATPGDIASLSAALAAHPKTAFSDWIEAQFAKPVTPDDLSLTIFRTAFAPDYPKGSYRAHTRDAEALRASLMIADNTHELRREVSYALSQIFVVSDEDTQLIGVPEGMCDWNDLLFRDAFGNFSTLVKDVTFHPVMAEFLTFANNAKAGFYNAGSRPDENYAREVMQLFTIGLVQLNPDGNTVTDKDGHAVPTYDQATITEVARVFTGLRYPPGMVEHHVIPPGGTRPTGWGLKKGNVRYGRDIIDEKRHDTGAKSFLGTKLPAGQGTEKDIDDTLQVLCEHPNAGPFLARGLIQRMVTSNPSPAYIKRVSQAYTGSHGDLKAVIKAILLDDEARNLEYALDPAYGKLREPWVRFTQVARAFNAKPAARQPFYPVYTKTLLPKLGQFPYSAPSVFNFYLPSYQSPGVVSEMNSDASDASTLVVDPEFQIMNSNTTLLVPNSMMDTLNATYTITNPKRSLLALDLTPQVGLASDMASLLGNVDNLLNAGMTSDRTRGIITQAVNALKPATDRAVLEERARMAIYLTLLSPDYAIQK